MRACPSLETLAGQPRDSSLDEHVRECATCSAALAATTPALAADSPALAARTAPPARDLETGTRAGRYTIERLLGRGGMGVVYVAADPELGRKVALKVLRDAASTAEARLVREAQAMARLAHPNVLVVHEVGRVDGRVYVASELVDGASLDGWLKAAARPWRAVVDVFVQAGRGLAAAHAAGIVHRDVKPANIFVGGDGRARVGDFGLARTELEADAPRGEGVADAGAADPELTAEGTIMGTPAYMAPEQRRGERATARSDQYSLCVALHEALTGTRITPGTFPPPFPGRPRLPSRLRAAISRGLEPRPERRHADVKALLAAIDQALRIPRALMAGGLTALVAAAAAAMALLRGTPPAPCLGAEARLTGAWDPTVKGALRTAILGSGVPHAQTTAERVDQGLDRYAGAWTRMHTEACEATAVRHDQSPALLDLRMACLDRRRASLGALTELLRDRPDGPLLERAVNAVKGLPAVADCADVRALGEALPLPDDPDMRAAVEVMRPRLASLAALGSAGRTKDATALALGALGDARALAHPPVRAELLLQLGLLERDGNPRASQRALEGALAAAAAARDDATAARALVALVAVVGTKLRLFDDARRLRPLAQAAVVRAGDPPAQRVALLLNLGLTEALAGEFAEAQRLSDEAVALGERALDPESPDLAQALTASANNHVRRKDYAHAVPMYERALAILTRALGERHPSVARLHNNLAAVEVDNGRPEQALVHARLAVSIFEENVGPDSTLLATVLTNQANALAGLGREAEATAIEERVLAIREHVDPDSTDAALIRDNLAIGYANAGRTDDALRLMLRSLAAREKGLGPDHPDVADTLVALGRLRLQRHEAALAREPLERGVAIYARVHGDDDVDTARARGDLASCLVALGRAAEGRRLAEAVLARLERADGKPSDLASMRFIVARALRATHGDAARARALAEEARRFYAGEGARRAAQLAEITAWLAAPQ